MTTDAAFDTMMRLKAEWLALDRVSDDLDTAISEPFWSQKRAAELAYLQALETLTGITGLVSLVYWEKEASHVGQQAGALAPRAQDDTHSRSGTAADVAAVGHTQGGTGAHNPASSAAASDEEALNLPTRVGSSETEGRYHGTVKFYKTTAPGRGYGYIRRDDGAEFYVRSESILFNASLKAGDRVTFTQTVTVSENAGMPAAVRVMVDGSTPAPRPQTGPTEAEKEHVRQQHARDRALRQTRKAEKQARDEANRRAFQTLFKGE